MERRSVCRPVLDSREALEFSLQWAAIKAGRRLPSRLGGSFPRRLVVRLECALPASLIGLARTLFNAQSLPPPTTHRPQTPCRVLQASNVFQLLGISKSMPCSLHANMLGTLRSRGHAASWHGPAVRFSYTSGQSSPTSGGASKIHTYDSNN